MPALDPSVAAMPSILSLLMPGTAPAAASSGEGTPQDFAALMSGLGPAEAALQNMADVPQTGSDLPPERPQLAGSPLALNDEIDVAEVMVGRGWTPELMPPPPAGPSPALALAIAAAPNEPEAPLPDQLAEALSLPTAPTQVHAEEKPLSQQPIAVAADPVLPRKIALLASVAQPLVVRHGGPVREQQREVDQDVDGEPAEAAASLLPPRLTPDPVQVEAAPPVPPVAATITEAAPPALPTTERAATKAASPVAASNSAPSDASSIPAQPLEPQVAAPSPPPAPAAPAELRIAPDIARQVAQMLTPATEPVDEPATESPAARLPVPASQPAPPAPTLTAPAPPVQLSQPAPVDLGRAEWMQAMIDRIAELPQAEGRREAHIRLLPDALGAVQVKLVEKDERVHVTLISDNAQARQLLTEAAPRLHELAEARGLRLAQPEVGGGSSQDRRPAPEQQSQTPSRPRSASADTDSDSATDGDRIA